MHFHMMALSDKPGNLTFYTVAGDVGDEQASLNPSFAGQPGWTAIPVEVTTVDEWLNKNSINHVDLLKMDGEGYDPWIMLGAEETLKRQAADMIQFEYNAKWNTVPGFDPNRHSLEAITKLLDKYGYDTFLIGKRNLFQLNRGLWSPSFEFYYWSNCWAMSRAVDADLRQRIVDSFNLDFPALKPTVEANH